MKIHEEFSHDKRYKFEVTQLEGEVYDVCLYAYQPQWKDYAPVSGMNQRSETSLSAIKLGTALLSLME